MRDDQVAVVEDEVADELVEELRGLLLELGRLAFELGERLGEPVGQLDVAAAEGADELDVVVAGNAECDAGLDHRQHEPQHGRNIGPSVDKVAEKDGSAALRMLRRQLFFRDPPAKLAQQCDEFREAAVDVADDVERAVLASTVRPSRLPLDNRRFDIVRRAEHGDVPEPLFAQVFERAAELFALAADYMRSEGPVGPVAVAVLAEPLRQIEDDRRCQHVVLACQRDQRLPGLRLHVRRIDHGQPSRRQSLRSDELQHLERVLGSRLIVLVVGDKTAEEIRRQDLRRQEVARSEG